VTLQTIKQNQEATNSGSEMQLGAPKLKDTIVDQRLSQVYVLLKANTDKALPPKGCPGNP